MPDRVPVSPTKLDVWQQCRFRFHLQYVQKVPVDGAWAHLSLGNAVHSALRDWFDLGDAARTPDAGAQLVRSNWTALGFRDPQQSEEWQERAADWVQRYCELHRAPVPLSRERQLGALAEHVTISGRIDRIDERGDELVIVDYKTGRRAPQDHNARVSRALAIYAIVATRSLRRPAYLVQLHHLPSGTVAEHRHTDESLARQLARVDSIGRDIQAALASGEPGDFPAEPSALCGWCDFRAHCPAGQSVPAQPRWAGLPDESTENPDADSFPM